MDTGPCELFKPSQMKPEPSFDLTSLGRRACRDLEKIFQQIDPAHLESLSQELVAARRIVCYGVGREGLMMNALAMRLMHAGFQSYVVGEMVTPPVRSGDVFFASAGPGYFPTIETLLAVARDAGGRTLIVTAQPARAAQMPADVIIHLPAQTMVDVSAGLSVLTMGTPYEAALLLFGDLLILRLLELTHQKREDMYTRYTNMK